MKIDDGVYNAILGKSYGEIAAESRTNHKSQGAALTRTRGEALEYFAPVAGDVAHADLMEGVNTSWSRIEGGEKIQPMVDDIIKSYSLSSPEKSVPALVNLYKALMNLTDDYWKSQKMKEVQQLIEDCMGLSLEATVRNDYVVQGESMSVTFTMLNRLKTQVSVNEITVDEFDTLYKQELSYNKNYLFTKAIRVSTNKPITQPYWLAEEMSPGSFNVKDQTLIGDPQSKPSFEVKFHLNIEGQEFIFIRPIQYRFTHPVKGDLYEPLTVLPPITASFDPSLMVFTDQEEKNFEVQTQNHTSNNIKPEIELTNTSRLNIKPFAQNYNATFAYSAKPATSQTAAFYSNVEIRLHGKTDTAKELKTISYDHIPRIDYFKDSKAKFVIADVKISGKHIGYIEGAGDKVPECLQQMGYDVVLLKEKDINASYLNQFDAIIAGIRAYEVHDWLFSKSDVLLDYVKEGGNFIVQYNRSNRIGTDNGKISPYHFSITNTRVTDEDAKVNFLIPDHAVLNYPNKITEKDFEGWVQERGNYFAGSIDVNFQSVLGMNDPGEPEQKGSLIIADYGKGKFVYTGLVFFRELPAGVPGAYRLFANIIALNRKRGF